MWPLENLAKRIIVTPWINVSPGNIDKKNDQNVQKYVEKQTNLKDIRSPCKLSAKDRGATESPVKWFGTKFEQNCTLEVFCCLSAFSCCWLEQAESPSTVLLKFSSKSRHLCASISAHSLHSPVNFSFITHLKYLYYSYLQLHPIHPKDRDP